MNEKLELLQEIENEMNAIALLRYGAPRTAEAYRRDLRKVINRLVTREES